MNEIKIRFYGYNDFGHEMWEIFTGQEHSRRFLLRDISGPGGQWLTGDGPDCEPSFPVKANITLILCDHDWNEQTRTGNDRARFPDEFPTLIDACRQAWNDYSHKPGCCLDPTDFWNWLSTKLPAGLNGVEQDNWLQNSRKTIRREVLQTFDYCGDKLAIVRVTEGHMNSCSLWRKYAVDMLNEDESDSYIHFYGYEVGNYVIATNPLQIANLPYRVQLGQTQLEITNREIRQFNAMIGISGKAPFRSHDPKVKHLVGVLKEQAAIHNAGLTPSIDKEYYCETCGSHSGKCHPTTGYCFVCGTDNWKPVDYTNV